MKLYSCLFSSLRVNGTLLTEVCSNMNVYMVCVCVFECISFYVYTEYMFKYTVYIIYIDMQYSKYTRYYKHCRQKTWK